MLLAVCVCICEDLRRRMLLLFCCVIYHTIPYHTMPYHTIPYRTIPYHPSNCLTATHAHLHGFCTGVNGLGKVSHVIARSTIKTNGITGVAFWTDAAQSSTAAYSFHNIGVWIVGCSIQGNGHLSQHGGGIKVTTGKALSRALYIISNTITSNQCHSGVGAAISVTLRGASTRNAAFSAALESHAIQDGFGTCLIKDNTVLANTAAEYVVWCHGLWLCPFVRSAGKRRR